MSNKLDRNFCFICGYPKSGTTLLLSLLDNHPELNTFPEELKFFRGVLKQHGLQNKIDYILTKTGAYVPKEGIADYPSGKRDYSDIDGKAYMDSLTQKLTQAKSDKELLQAIFDNWLDFSLNSESKINIRYHVEKTPDNEFYTDIIERWFDQTKYIYILRDPRDNYLSYLKKQPTLTLDNFLYTWKKSVESIKKLSTSKVLFIRYEDLVLDLKKSLKKIQIFLDISYHENLERPTRNGKLWGGNSMFNNNDTKVHAKAVSRYKKHLDHKSIEIIESCLYDYLNEFDYEIDFAKSSKRLPVIKNLRMDLNYKLKNYIIRLGEIR